ncbi:hypothetical protein [Streptomyces sp. NPDC021224]|uniref:hypothetical protein n=1 Tax=unclassified Streptomyces TaxID=2593676 RepID=UPI0037A28437
MSLTLVTMLSCGQGAMTLVEVYDMGDLTQPADFLALIDCGSDDINVPGMTGGAIKYVTDKVLARKPSVLDLVVLSHQDKDHINLLPELGKRLGAAGVKVKEIYRCGVNWDPDKSEPDVLEFAQRVHYTGSLQFDLNPRSDYWAKSPTCIAQYKKKVFFRILFMNMPSTVKKEKNQSSGVVVVEDVSSAPHLIAVLPGDITCHTMGWIHDQVGEPNERHPLRDVVVLAAPHHGARATAVTRCGGRWENFDRFAQTVRPQHLGASAGPGNRHDHPVFEVLDRFRGGVDNVKVVSGVSSHGYATFVEAADEWENKTVSEGIWSTVSYFDEAEKRLSRKRRSPASGAPAAPSPFINTKMADIVITLHATLGVKQRVKLRPVTPGNFLTARDLVLLAPAP